LIFVYTDPAVVNCCCIKRDTQGRTTLHATNQNTLTRESAMANSTIADFATFRNQQMEVNEKIATSLWNLEALMAVLLTTRDFSELANSTMHDYFSVVASVISEIIALHQTNLTDYSLYEE